MKIRLASAALVLLLLTPTVLAVTDDEYQRFMKESPVFAASEKEMNDTWKQLRKKLGKEDFSLLLEEQRQWITQRDASANSADDLAQKNIERTQFLKQYLAVGYVKTSPQSGTTTPSSPAPAPAQMPESASLSGLVDEYHDQDTMMWYAVLKETNGATLATIGAWGTLPEPTQNCLREAMSGKYRVTVSGTVKESSGERWFAADVPVSCARQ